MNACLSPVAVAIRAVLGVSVSMAAAANAFGGETPVEELPTVFVSATAIVEDPQKIASSFSVLEDEELFERTRATLGDTLNGMPGVHADTFGGGSTRPVVRGQTAPRVAVLSDSATLLDASDISPDHAVTSEPMLVRRVEVLRGPATLLYGSGAIGGVVNLIDGKVPTAMPEGRYDGMVALRGGTAGRERAVAAALTAQAGSQFAVHLEGTSRQADDYRARGGEEPRVDGTYAGSDSLSAGMSWVRDNGYLGLAYTWRDDGYGVPGHNHEYESCHPHGSALHCGSHDAGEGDHDHGHEEHEVPAIALENKRFDLRGEWREPFAGVERIRLRASSTDYRHDELDEGEIGSTFRNDGYEGRVEVQHAAFGGWRGVVGLQYANTRFRSSGAEAFMPTIKTDSKGLFAIEHFELNEAIHFELGARHEWLEHRPVNDTRNRPAFDDAATSFSGAVVWEVTPDNYLTLSAARSERLPHGQELYARGIHLATNTYECGLMPHPRTCGGLANNAPIRTETSQNVELAWRRTAGAFTFALNGYHNQVGNYIHARTLDQYEDFRLIKYTQRDASFRGAEAEATWRFAFGVAATVFGDFVQAKFDGGGNLPRIPASRVGLRLARDIGRIGGELEYFHVNEQNDIAEYETATPGYDMVNFTVSYRPPGDLGVDVYLRGSNLLNERVWNHSSYLANVVPLPGRNLSLGIRLAF